MPAEVNLGESMRGRRVMPSDSHVMTVTSGKKKGGEEELVESELGAAGIIERPRATQLPPMNPKPRLPPPWQQTAPKSRFQRPTRPPPPPPKPELPPKPNLPPSVVIERGKKLGREKFREIPIPDDDLQNHLNFPQKADFGDADGERDVLGESTTTVNTTASSLAALLDGDGGRGCWASAKGAYHFFMETKEYADPHQFGWRIKFRRAFLSVGVLMFTYLTVFTAVSTQNFSSKKEIQQLLDYAGANLTWPDSGSVLDVSAAERVPPFSGY